MSDLDSPDSVAGLDDGSCSAATGCLELAHCMKGMVCKNLHKLSAQSAKPVAVCWLACGFLLLSARSLK